MQILYMAEKRSEDSSALNVTWMYKLCFEYKWIIAKLKLTINFPCLRENMTLFLFPRILNGNHIGCVTKAMLLTRMVFC